MIHIQNIQISLCYEKHDGEVGITWANLLTRVLAKFELHNLAKISLKIVTISSFMKSCMDIAA